MVFVISDIENLLSFIPFFISYLPSPFGRRCHGEAVTDEGSTDFGKSLPAVTDEGARPYAAFFSLVRHRSITVVTTTTLSATTPT